MGGQLRPGVVNWTTCPDWDMTGRIRRVWKTAIGPESREASFSHAPLCLVASRPRASVRC